MTKENDARKLFFLITHRQNKVAIKVVRIFNTYGPRMHPQDGRVISNFIVQLSEPEPITNLWRRKPDKNRSVMWMT